MRDGRTEGQTDRHNGTNNSFPLFLRKTIIIASNEWTEVFQPRKWDDLVEGGHHTNSLSFKEAGHKT